MAECLDEKLIKEKEEFFMFLRKDKKFEKDAGSYGMSPKDLILKDISIEAAFQIISMYSEWETNVYIIHKAHKCFPNMYSYFVKNSFKKMADASFPDNFDFDYCDSDMPHF